MASILNDTNLRKSLAQNNILIPEYTIFIPAQHITTTNKLDIDYKPVKLKYYINKIDNIISLINSSLPCNNNSIDWSNIRPEWGLARNASFIIGNRSLTKSVDLEGRAFLHSYDHEQDINGKILDVIMNSAMIVTEWINMQYLFSTLDNNFFGAGSKVTTNITGKFGIIQGNSSDLMNGFALQSIYTDHQHPYHESQRLLVIIEAPPKIVKAIIKKSEILTKLVSNEWLKISSFYDRNFTEIKL